MELGKKVFKPYWLQIALPLVGFLFFFIIGLVVLINGNGKVALFLFGMSAPLLLVTVVIWNRRLIVGPGGIIQKSLFGQQKMKWSEITDARYEVSRMDGIEHHITLMSAYSGEVMKINPGYVVNESIVDFILTHVGGRKALQILLDINRGREVKYSQFNFTEDGLRCKGKEIPWESLSSVRLIPSYPEYFVEIHSDTYEKPLRVMIMEYVSRSTVCELLNKQLQAHGKPGIVIE